MGVNSKIGKNRMKNGGKYGQKQVKEWGEKMGEKK